LFVLFENRYEFTTASGLIGGGSGTPSANNIVPSTTGLMGGGKGTPSAIVVSGKPGLIGGGNGTPSTTFIPGRKFPGALLMARLESRTTLVHNKMPLL
jgi:hypothetical protein